MPTNPREYLWPGIIAAQAIHVAAKLRIPDLLASGPKTIAELASDSGAHPPTLDRLLRALSTLKMFARTPNGRFRNTPLTEVLRTDHPQSQRDAGLFLPAALANRVLVPVCYFFAVICATNISLVERAMVRSRREATQER